MPEPILVEIAATVATVTLNRPDRLNALDEASWKRLGESFTRLDGDETVRCVVVRGAGARGFGAGADISEFAERRSGSEQAREYGRIELGGIEAVAACRHPTIAAIHGACVGGGLAIALACDIRVAADTARFGMPVSRLGLTMAYGELRVLQRVVGPAVAADMLLSAEVFGAERALRQGLVTRLVRAADLDDEVAALARRIADGAPLVHRWHKRFIRRLEEPTPLSEEEVAEGYACFDTGDYRRGYEAFLAKRKPEFEGS